MTKNIKLDYVTLFKWKIKNSKKKQFFFKNIEKK